MYNWLCTKEFGSGIPKWVFHRGGGNPGKVFSWIFDATLIWRISDISNNQIGEKMRAFMRDLKEILFRLYNWHLQFYWVNIYKAEIAKCVIFLCHPCISWFWLTFFHIYIQLITSSLIEGWSFIIRSKTIHSLFTRNRLRPKVSIR